VQRGDAAHFMVKSILFLVRLGNVSGAVGAI